VAEYVLYAMPGEEAYGKNDIVFACEGFLPLVLDPELVLEPQSWKLFNELKVQVESFPPIPLLLANLILTITITITPFRSIFKDSTRAARKRLTPASSLTSLSKACRVIQASMSLPTRKSSSTS
jgi:hypothetical protein